MHTAHLLREHADAARATPQMERELSFEELEKIQYIFALSHDHTV
jgi:hypothetical protein